MRVGLNSPIVTTIRLNSSPSVMNDDPGVIFLGGGSTTSSTQTDTSAHVVYVPQPSNSSPMPTIINASGGNNFFANIFWTALGLIALLAGGRFAWTAAARMGVREPADQLVEDIKKHLGFNKGDGNQNILQKVLKIIDDAAVGTVDRGENLLDQNRAEMSQVGDSTTLKRKQADFNDETKVPSSINQLINNLNLSSNQAIELENAISNKLETLGLVLSETGEPNNEGVQYRIGAIKDSRDRAHVFMIYKEPSDSITNSAVRDQIYGIEVGLRKHLRETVKNIANYTQEHKLQETLVQAFQSENIESERYDGLKFVHVIDLGKE